jgi:hypothetical protein
MNERRTALTGALVALAGSIASGPASLWLVAAIQPQPRWSGTDAFVEAFHPVQSVPYVAGFLLVGGFVMLVAGLHAFAPRSIRGRTATGVAFVSAFASLITLNYAIQTTVVPTLVTASSDTRAVVAWLTMTNPRSVGWVLEMWGYALLGLATWLVAPAFSGHRDRLTRSLFMINGPFSIIGAVATAVRPGWVLEPVGLVAFAAWNVLVVAMTASAAWSLSGRRGGTAYGPLRVVSRRDSRFEEVGVRPAND